MSKGYQNPPIVEAICEIAFKDVLDPTVPGLFYTKAKKNYPGLQNIQQVRFINGNFPTQATASQFISVDGRTIIQLGQALSIHQLAPYSSWPQFLAHILEMYSWFLEISPNPVISRVSLRYLNRFSIKGSTLETLASHVAFIPQFPISRIEEIKNMVMIIEAQAGDDLQKISFGQESALQNEGSMVGGKNFLLDLSCSRPIAELDSPILESWLNQAHNKIEDIFEKSLTIAFKEVFNEGGE